MCSTNLKFLKPKLRSLMCLRFTKKRGKYHPIHRLHLWIQNLSSHITTCTISTTCSQQDPHFSQIKSLGGGKLVPRLLPSLPPQRGMSEGKSLGARLHTCFPPLSETYYQRTCLVSKSVCKNMADF